MEKDSQEPSAGKAKSTALVLLNTRAIGGYKSVSEMLKPNAEMPWGNHFAFLPVPLPKLTDYELQNPLKFVKNAHKTIKRQRNSAAVYLTGQFLDLTRKIRGPEVRLYHHTRSLLWTNDTLVVLLFMYVHAPKSKSWCDQQCIVSYTLRQHEELLIT